MSKDEIIITIAFVSAIISLIIYGWYIFFADKQPITDFTNTTNISIIKSALVSTVIEGNASQQIILSPNGTLIINQKSTNG
ncbi:MAG: hypothetical protein ACP5IB_06665 [Thermoplasmata archaeon]